MLPNFLIVGAQKSGTSSLSRWLRGHPDVYLPPEKELHHFSKRTRDDEVYRRAFAGVTRRAVGEATPEYLYCPWVASAARELLGPETRCVAIVRNPVDRAYSHYWHARRLGLVTTSFEQALADEERVVAREDASAWYSFVDRGRYVRQLQRFERRFGREQLHVELFDDLVGDSDATTRRVLTFIGVDPSAFERPRMYRRINPAKRSKLPPIAARQISRVRVGTPRRRWLNARAFEVFVPPPMASATRERLHAQLAPEIDALASWLGRDLTAWS